MLHVAATASHWWMLHVAACDCFTLVDAPCGCDCFTLVDAVDAPRGCDCFTLVDAPCGCDCFTLVDAPCGCDCFTLHRCSMLLHIPLDPLHKEIKIMFSSSAGKFGHLTEFAISRVIIYNHLLLDMAHTYLTNNIPSMHTLKCSQELYSLIIKVAS